MNTITQIIEHSRSNQVKVWTSCDPLLKSLDPTTVLTCSIQAEWPGYRDPFWVRLPCRCPGRWRSRVDVLLRVSGHLAQICEASVSGPAFKASCICRTRRFQHAKGCMPMAWGACTPASTGIHVMQVSRALATAAVTPHAKSSKDSAASSKQQSVVRDDAASTSQRQGEPYTAHSSSDTMPRRCRYGVAFHEVRVQHKIRADGARHT